MFEEAGIVNEGRGGAVYAVPSCGSMKVKLVLEAETVVALRGAAGTLRPAVRTSCIEWVRAPDNSAEGGKGGEFKPPPIGQLLPL